jgi:hypothetical protein
MNTSVILGGIEDPGAITLGSGSLPYVSIIDETLA